MMRTLKINNLSVKKNDRFGIKKDILSNINFELNFGKIISLFGPSGAGKTTLFNLLSRNEDLTIEYKGSVSFYVKKNEIQLVNQNYNDCLNPYRSSIDIIKDYNNTLSDKTLEYVLENLDINFNLPIGILSGGQKQKIYLLKNLLNTEKKLFLLDEPFSSLDKLSISKIFNLLKQLINPDRMFLIISHDILSSLKYSDNVLFLKNNGKEIFLIDNLKTQNSMQKISSLFGLEENVIEYLMSCY